MNSVNLENLIKTGQLKQEPFNQLEFNGLLSSGQKRLIDANNFSMSPDSRFDLAYNAAHALSLAALRLHHYRPSNRYIVFQVLPYTLSLGPEVWRVLAKCHHQRNLAEYEGYLEIDDKLLIDLLTATKILLERLQNISVNKIQTTLEKT